jgi:hypothetical protein
MMTEPDKPDAEKVLPPRKAAPGLWGGMTRRLAMFLARTGYGEKVLAQEADLSALRRKPSFSLYMGLALIALSYIVGGPAIVLGGYMAVMGAGSWIMAAAAVAVFILVHLVFAAGAWLAGANYAAVLLHWVVRRFLLGHAERNADPA